MLFRGGHFVARLRPQTLIRSCAARSVIKEHTLTPCTANSLSRDSGSAQEQSIAFSARRYYADAPVSRPKAHTGRTTTGGRKSSKSAVKAKSTGSAAKKTTKAKPKAKEATKKRTKAKAKAKPKRKVLTEAQKQRKLEKEDKEKLKELKKKALLKTPKKLPATAWTLFNAERAKSMKGQKGVSLAQNVRESAAEFKQLSPERLEHYNHEANQNKAQNARDYQKWITSFSPKEVYDANNARLALARRLGKKSSQKYSKLSDERLVHRPTTGYIAFSQSRHKSGDFKGLALADAAKLAGREWKALSTSEKQPYLDQANRDRSRYKTEAATVYNAK